MSCPGFMTRHAARRLLLALGVSLASAGCLTPDQEAALRNRVDACEAEEAHQNEVIQQVRDRIQAARDEIDSSAACEDAQDEALAILDEAEESLDEVEE